jgi:hypothetical protein
METCELLEEGSIQEMGDNTLRFIKHMTSLDEHYPSKERNHSTLDNAVYFDIVGLYMVATDTRTLLSINMAVLVISSIMLLRSFYAIDSRSFAHSLKSFTVAFTMTGISWFTSMIFSASCAVLLWLVFDKKLTFFSMHPYYPLLLYGMPSLLGALIPIKLFSNLVSINQRSVHVAVWLEWIIMLIISTIFKVGIGYIPLVMVSCLTLGHLFHGNGFINKSITMITMVPALTLLTFMIFALMDLFVPIMGRLGNKPADLIISILTSLVIYVIFTPIMPLLFQNDTSENRTKTSSSTSRYRANIPTLLVSILFILSCGLVAYSAFVLHPYQEIRPKRLIVEHVHEFITKHEIDSNTRIVSSTVDQLPNRSYMGIASLDHIPETFLSNYLDQQYKYTNNTPLYFLATFGTPVNRSEGFYTRQIEPLQEATKLVPLVYVDYDHEHNKTYITVDERSSNIFFSREIRIYSATKFNATSLGDAPEEKTSAGLYKFGWIRFIGAAHHPKDRIHRVWIRTSSNEAFSGIVGVKVITTVVENQHYSSTLNETLSVLPDFVAAGPAMVSVVTLNLKDGYNLTD